MTQEYHGEGYCNTVHQSQIATEGVVEGRKWGKSERRMDAQQSKIDL